MSKGFSSLRSFLKTLCMRLPNANAMIFRVLWSMASHSQRWLFFLPTKLRFFNMAVRYYLHHDSFSVRMIIQIADIHRRYYFFCFFSVLITLSVDIFRFLDISRMPLALLVISIICFSIPGLQPLFLYSSMNDFPEHSFVLH